MEQIQAQELRIGNWIKDALSGEFQINHRYLFALADKPSLYDDVEPIPLTEECLLKFGCYEIISGRNIYTTPNGFRFLFDKENMCAKIDISNAITMLYHVHKLQNAVSITGEELTINTKEV